MENDSVFQEPPDEIDDTWRHGALFGGMASVMDNLDMAISYRRAAECLLERNTKDFEGYEVVCPVLFLYRHTIELYLKAIILQSDETARLRNEHSLENLLTQVTEIVREKGFEIPEKAKHIVKEFHERDERSTTFRYGEGLKPGEDWIDFGVLRGLMDWFFTGLERIHHLG